jgi:ADP-heptose:LPS heptosyltransferase
MAVSCDKILVISLAGIGDTLLATPLIHELRANFPKAQIDALVLWAGSRDLLQANPHLNAVHQCNFLKQSKLESFRFLAKLRTNGYDLSINSHPQSRIHYRGIARIINARLRISHVYECSGLLDRLLINRTLPQDYEKHTVENNLNILPLLDARPLLPRHEMEIFPGAAEQSWAEAFFAEHQLSHRKVLAVHTGSGGTKNLKLKRWPLENYLRLFRILKQTRPGLTVLLFGGPEEAAEIAQITSELGTPFALRATTKSLLQAAALMTRCNAFLSVDTALMHLAAAVKVSNQIVIEAPTLNATNLPYGNPFTLVLNPAVHGRQLEFYRYDGCGIQGTREELIRCMKAVTPEMVLQAINDRLPEG